MVVLLFRNLWFNAICWGPFILIKESKYSKQLLNHEYIHFRQQLEMGFIFAYIWYVVEFLIKLVYYRNVTTAYYSVSFEREAYGFQNIIGYAGHRKPYSWIHLVYVVKKKQFSNVEDILRKTVGQENPKNSHLRVVK